MIIKFTDSDLESLYSTPIKQLGKTKISKEVILLLRKTIKLIKYADTFSELYKFKGLRLEALKEKKYENCYSVKVNKQYRLILSRDNGQELVISVLELSKHYE